MQSKRLLINFFQACDRRGIRYCHWKSNDHVLEGMAGVTDLDILVERTQTASFEELLLAYGFKQDSRFFCSRFPAIHGYLGYDRETGILVFIHLHYNLVLGVPSVREYHLPWESIALDSRVYDEEANLYVIEPGSELQCDHYGNIPNTFRIWQKK